MGETLLWHQIADRLGKTLTECKRGMTGREFLQWKAYEEWKVNSFDRLDYFLAQIAAEIRMGNSSNPGRVKLADYLIKFTFGDKSEEKPLTEDEKARRIANSKAMWFGRFGIQP